MRHFPTEANFVLTEMGERCKEVVTRLRERDILVRDRSAERPGTVRMTVGNFDQACTPTPPKSARAWAGRT